MDNDSTSPSSDDDQSCQCDTDSECDICSQDSNFFTNNSRYNICDDDEENEDEEDNDDTSGNSSHEDVSDEDSIDENESSTQHESSTHSSVDMLEENNNDPNNNLDNENSDNEAALVEVNIPNSPRPGCSKDFDEMEVSPNSLQSSRDISHVAEHILQTISKLQTTTHASIVAALIKAQSSGKKTLTLYDLLSENTETSYSGIKRTNSEDICSIEMKRVCQGERKACSPLNTGFVMNSPLFNLEHVPRRSKSVDSLERKISPHQAFDRNSHENKDRENTQPIRNFRVVPSKPKEGGLPINLTLRASHVDAKNPTRTTLIANIKRNNSPVKLNSGAPIPLKNPRASATVTSNSYQQLSVNNALAVQQQFAILQAPRLGGPGNMHQYAAVGQSLPKIENKVIRQQPRLEFPPAHPMNLPVAKNKSTKLPFPQQVPDPSHVKAHLHDIQNQILGDIKATQPSIKQNNLRQQLDNLPTKFPNNGKVCEEIYQKLRAIFPDINKNYIKEFCPPDWAPDIEHDVQFANIVDQVLVNEPHWELDLDRQQASTSNQGVNDPVPNVDDTFEYLTGIFPNADPHFLRQAAQGFKSNSAIDAFVDQKLQKADYPTREQYLAKLKITQEQQRYTTNFVVSDFLKIFPDPFSHFEDPNRKCVYSLVASEFLKSTFNWLRVADIGKYYSECRYNMSLTAKRLYQCKEFMKSRRAHREIPTEDIPMLQEMAFIRHQNEIRQYVDGIKAKEKLEFDDLKATGGLLQCQCCYDDECMPSKCSTCDNGHIFCNSCVINGTDSRLGDGETHVACFLACGAEFSLSTLQNILAPTKFSILLKKRQAAEVEAAGLEGLVACPFCHFASIPAEDDKVFKCLNPECMKESCIQCKEPNHVPLRCDEVSKQDKARKYIEEKMTQALARTCYKCKKAFFKEEGCNKITCTCGAIMCFICNQPVKDYSHFGGQGSNDPKKCPLWTDNRRLNAETVRKVAETARNELLKADPSLRINTDQLAPELPPPTAGPHNDIPGAERLANELAARVMKH